MIVVTSWGGTARPPLQLTEYGPETAPRGAALLSVPTAPKPRARGILIHYSQDSMTPQPYSQNPEHLGWGSWDTAIGSPSGQEVSGRGEGSARDQRGVLTISTWPSWGQNLALEVQRPATAWGWGPLTSFTDQTLEGRKPAAGFPFLKDPVALAQQVGGEPLPAQP